MLVYLRAAYLCREACAPLVDGAVSMAACGSHLHSRRLPLESEVVIKFPLVSGRRSSHSASPNLTRFGRLHVTGPELGFLREARERSVFRQSSVRRLKTHQKKPKKPRRAKFGTHLPSCTGGGTKRDARISRGYSHEKAATF